MYSLTLNFMKGLAVFCFRVVILVDKKLLTDHMEKLNTSKHKRLSLDEDSLRWTPLISSQALMEEEKQTENEVFSEFQIRRGNRGNLGIISHISR